MIVATEEQIRTAIKKLDGMSKFLGRKEIKELPSILWEDELPEKIVQGFYKNGQGLLVATNKRLVFVNKKLIGVVVEDFPYDKMTSIQYETKIFFGQIRIFASGNRAEIEQIDKKQVRDFCDYVRSQITHGKSHASPKQAANHDDVIEQLEKLAKLKEKGILTKEEFAAKKKQLLGL